MHVISSLAIRLAANNYPNSANALAAWLKLLKENNFKNFTELKQIFGSVDKLGKFWVFDVAGNKLRIITAIHFNRGKVYVRAILNHKQYDQEDWKTL
ncbi:MAG: type II toxin-antitoxin system HigB family toxin [Gammaproteobacteria bacterium]